jgi:hypothetical protein
MLCCAATATCHKVIGFTIEALRMFTEMAFMYFALISQMMACVPELFLSTSLR